MLRRASIDELPQLINVLEDEMSLVGPDIKVLVRTLCMCCAYAGFDPGLRTSSQRSLAAPTLPHR